MRALPLLIALTLSIGGLIVRSNGERKGKSRQIEAEDFVSQSVHGSKALHNLEEGFSIYSSLWYHSQRVYAILEGPDKSNFSKGTRLGKNVELASLPVEDARDFYSNIKGQWHAGLAILVDFPFPAHPTNLGLWLEVMVPIFCVLEEGTWQASFSGQQPVDSIVFLNTYEDEVVDVGWLWSVWAVAMSPDTGLKKRPKLIFADHINSVNKDQWLGFDHILVAHNRYTFTSKTLGFTSQALASKFRETAYRLAGLDLPNIPKKSITFMSSVAGEMVVNQLELLEHVDQVAASLGLKNRPYTATGEAPFSSFVSVMRRTGVLIARHGALLANAAFLPPGSVVIELLPYNWDWDGASSFYKNLTSSMGDIHHFAWRALSPETAYYLSDSDALYQNWTHAECSSPECITAHATAGMMVDCSAIEKLLREIVPKAISGASVSDLELRWPSI